LKVTVLGPIGCPASIVKVLSDAGVRVIEAYSKRSWQIETALWQFYDETLYALSKVSEGVNGGRLGMYSGSAYHAAILAKISGEFEMSSRAVLFREMVKGWSSDFARRSLAFMASAEINIDHKHVGLGAPITHAPDWDVVPHPPSISFTDAQLWREGSVASRAKRTILFPGSNTVGKGYFLGLAIAISLAQRGYVVYVRDCGIDLSGTGVKTLPPAMDEKDFFKRISQADLLVLPYLPAWFSERTSGLVADALALNTPVACIAGTWLADFIHQNSSGLILPMDAEKAISAILEYMSGEGVEACRDALSVVAERYIEQNSWTQFLKFFSQDH